MSSELTIFILGLVFGLLIDMFKFWLEGKREVKRFIREQRKEDVRTARNWAANGKKESLRGFDLRAANLSGKDLVKADLEESDFGNARMWGTNLSGANLIRAKFQQAKLVGVNLSGADLRLAEFSNAELHEVDFSGAKLRRARLSGAKYITGCIWDSAQIDETTELTEELHQEILKSKEKELAS